MTAKYIFVTGGVVSSVGKGICAASIGRILKSRGVSVAIQKLDPYLNVDPGTMSPYQHGEVFVTKDGCETDMDLGHYERFIDIELTESSNVTAGQIYTEVIGKERRGDYLGGTIQIVPHVTNAIKAFMRRVAEEHGPDVVVVEVGGTVGDIEGQPFLEAIRQMRTEVGRDNTYYIHVTLLPYIGATGELKTKPTQHSVRELRAIGIQPDAIVCRSDFDIPDDIKDKLSLFCDVRRDAVIPMKTAQNIYQVPGLLEDARMADTLAEALGLDAAPNDMADWRDMVERMTAPHAALPIAVVGKYADLPDAYISVREALRHAGLHIDRDVSIEWVQSENVERDGADAWLSNAAGIVVPGGFGERGIEGMISSVSYAREHRLPYLGLCLGMQVMVIEHARGIAGLERANSSEFDPRSPHPVIDYHARSARGERARRHDAPGQLPVRAVARVEGGGGLRHRGSGGASPSPVRVQQRVPRAVAGGGPACERAIAGREAGGDSGAGGAPVHGGGAVSPGVPARVRSRRTRCSARSSRRPAKSSGRAASRNCRWRLDDVLPAGAPLSAWPAGTSLMGLA